MRWGQLAHLVLLVGVAAAYAALKVALPPDDPARTRIDVALALVAAIWAALLFIELLRGQAEGSLKARALASYRRLLHRPATLLGSDLALASGLALLLYLELAYRAVEFYSFGDVEVVQDDPGAPARPVGSLKAKVPSSLRLRVGEHSLVFYPGGSDPGRARASSTALLRVPPPWREMKRVVVQEIRTYGSTR